MTIALTVLDVSHGAAPLAGAAVYVWHCDRDGNYSLYSNGATQENYPRGVQETGADGTEPTPLSPGAARTSPAAPRWTV